MLATVGCVKKKTGTMLFVYDGTTQSVLVWKDVNNVYAPTTGTTPAAADATITSGLLTSVTPPLAWGGLAMDTNTNMLYLVTQGGWVTRISDASSQSGSLSNTTDIIQFTLGSATDRFSSGSVFGQAAVDSSRNTLYVMETSTDGTGTRVWTLPTASQIANGATFAAANNATLAVASDTWGSGVAAGGSGTVYGLFGGGSGIVDPSDPSQTVAGPRLRQGQNNVFPTNALNLGQNVIFGSGTGLTGTVNYGSLAYDGLNNVVYAFGQPSATFATTPASTAQIEVFTTSQFTSGGNQTPNRTLTGVTSNLRIISHPQDSDWLLGATFTPDTSTTAGVPPTGAGGSDLLIWKAPSGGGAATSITLPGVNGGTPEIRGMAIGGNN
jgi:hypothetical protein